MADALYVNPNCGGKISYPDCYYTWYDSRFPQAVIGYGEQVCPGCAAWANGTYQCVSFVRGAYSQYSLCQPHDVEGKCEDHARVPVAVSAKAPHLSAGEER